jgi:hypothetical protein
MTQTKTAVAVSKIEAPTNGNAKVSEIAKSAKRDPLTEKVLRIGECQKKALQIQALREMLNELSQFRISTTGENASHLEISCNGSRESFDTRNPYLIERVIGFIQDEVTAKIPQLETELLAATI